MVAVLADRANGVRGDLLSMLVLLHCTRVVNFDS